MSRGDDEMTPRALYLSARASGSDPAEARTIVAMQLGDDTIDEQPAVTPVTTPSQPRLQSARPPWDERLLRAENNILLRRAGLPRRRSP